MTSSDLERSLIRSDESIFFVVGVDIHVDVVGDVVSSTEGASNTTMELAYLCVGYTYTLATYLKFS